MTKPVIPSRLDLRKKDAVVYLADVYQGPGLKGFPKGSIKRLRVIGVPPKPQPQKNVPVLGVSAEEPGKFVLGTVPVEEDGSAFFSGGMDVQGYWQER